MELGLVTFSTILYMQHCNYFNVMHSIHVSENVKKNRKCFFYCLAFYICLEITAEHMSSLIAVSLSCMFLYCCVTHVHLGIIVYTCPHASNS